MNEPRVSHGPLRFIRRNALRFLLVFTIGFFSWAGNDLLARKHKHEAEEKLGYSPPPEAFPKPSAIAKNNNNTAELHLPPDLEGTAVIYPEQVDGLVDRDGVFRTGLSLSELARVLRVDTQKIASEGSKDEIDPDAVLFCALTGTLSEQAKAKSWQLREVEIRMGQPPSSVADGWVQCKLSFCLNALLHPSADQKLVLDAISRSALLVPRFPGAKISAVPLPFDPEREQPSFAPGYLPIEAAAKIPDACEVGSVDR